MFVDPGTAVTTALAWIRETSIICGIVVVGWHARGVYQTVDNFVEAVKTHMKTMEGFALRMEGFALRADGFAFRAETNHLKHIEQYLYRLAINGPRPISNPDLVAAEEIQPPDPVEPPNAV